MPSSQIHNSKWRALLAHVAPLNLLPAPSANKSPSVSPIALANDITHESHDSPSVCSDQPTTDLQLIHHLHSVAAANKSISCLEAGRRIAPCCNSSPLRNDVDQLLYACLDAPYDFDKQARSLDTLCTLCSATPGAADTCVDSGAIDIVLGMLNSPRPPRHAQLIPSPFVENSEKALHLLHLITTSSETGCAAALQQTTLIVTTLGKKLLRVSEGCTASAIAILCRLCCHSEAALFRKAVSETAIPSKLVVVLQVASKDSTKRRAGRLLRLLSEQEQA